MEVLDLGRMSYGPCVDRQREILEQVAAGEREDTLIFVEHNPVLTLGAGFHEENLLLTKEQYEARGIEVTRTDRGGDVTYHGPGQLVIYPIFDISRHGKNLHKWLRDLEEAVILSLAAKSVEGRRFPPHTGVWVGDEKIAAIGIKVRRWVSMHGIALNCEHRLENFGLIVPCGIQGYGVTSISAQLGRSVLPGEMKEPVAEAFRQVFGAC